MAKLSQKAVRERADEWAVLLRKIRTAEAARDAALAPIIERHADELAPVLNKHDAKIEKLQAHADEIYREVKEWLEARGEPVRLEGERAVAEFRIATKLGPRVVDVKRFLDAARPKGEAMFDCISILVAKAEAVLGKRDLDAISHRPETKVIEAGLKLKDS